MAINSKWYVAGVLLIGAVIGIVAACVVVAAGAVTAGVLIGKKKKAKKDGE